MLIFCKGCGFQSKNKYMFGKASAQIKLVDGDSAGTVIAFYVRNENQTNIHQEYSYIVSLNYYQHYWN